jgi:hypothetical protein
LDWSPSLAKFDCGGDTFSRFGASSFESRRICIFKLAIPISEHNNHQIALAEWSAFEPSLLRVDRQEEHQ